MRAKKFVKKIRTFALSPVQYSIDQSSSKIHNLEGQIRELDNKVANLANRRSGPGVIKLSKSEMVVKLFDGTKIYLDPMDSSVAMDTALDGIWEPHVTSPWLSTIKPSDIVFDVGANFGYFGLLAARRTDRKYSKIVFFEANPKLVSYINKSLAINWVIEQSAVENLAVSDRIGKAKLNVLEGYTGSSSLHSPAELSSYLGHKMPVEVEKVIDVSSTTIDDYCANNDIREVNVIKMDIEGFEDKAYKGMRKTIANSSDLTLFVEFTKEAYDDPEAFYNSMLEDFRTVYVVTNDGRAIKPKDNSYSAVVAGTEDWIMLIFSKGKREIAGQKA